MSGIRLHSKYGVNPTITQCFWCGKDKNEIALLGAAYRGEAPMHMCLDYEPCDECKANRAAGITFIEVSHTPKTENQPALAERAYPTGTWSVVKEHVLDQIHPQELRDAILKRRAALILTEDWDAMGLPRANIDNLHAS